MAWQSWFYAKHPVVIPMHLAGSVGTIAITAFVLGTLVGGCLPGVLVLVRHLLEQSQYLAWLAPLQMYLLVWSCFHLLEFVVTAYWNPIHLQSDSFLLQNGFEYVAAHIFGVLEYMLECASTRPAWKHTQFIQCVGLALILTGQLLRSFAMIHASTNFSHALAYTKREDHTLVTTGVYALARHPSYAGFFWWALGTQIFLGNPIATVGFAVLLTRFFAHRIQIEEHTLRAFFGEAYRAYEVRVPRGVPLVGWFT